MTTTAVLLELGADVHARDTVRGAGLGGLSARVHTKDMVELLMQRYSKHRLCKSSYLERDLAFALGGLLQPTGDSGGPDQTRGRRQRRAQCNQPTVYDSDPIDCTGVGRSDRWLIWGQPHIRG